MSSYTSGSSSHPSFDGTPPTSAHGSVTTDSKRNDGPFDIVSNLPNGLVNRDRYTREILKIQNFIRDDGQLKHGVPYEIRDKLFGKEVVKNFFLTRPSPPALNPPHIVKSPDNIERIPYFMATIDRNGRYNFNCESMAMKFETSRTVCFDPFKDGVDMFKIATVYDSQFGWDRPGVKPIPDRAPTRFKISVENCIHMTDEGKNYKNNGKCKLHYVDPESRPSLKCNCRSRSALYPCIHGTWKMEDMEFSGRCAQFRYRLTNGKMDSYMYTHFARGCPPIEIYDASSLFAIIAGYNIPYDEQVIWNSIVYSVENCGYLLPVMPHIVIADEFLNLYISYGRLNQSTITTLIVLLIQYLKYVGLTDIKIIFEMVYEFLAPRMACRRDESYSACFIPLFQLWTGVIYNRFNFDAHTVYLLNKKEINQVHRNPIGISLTAALLMNPTYTADIILLEVYLANPLIIEAISGISGYKDSGLKRTKSTYTPLPSGDFLQIHPILAAIRSSVDVQKLFEYIRSVENKPLTGKWSLKVTQPNFPDPRMAPECIDVGTNTVICSDEIQSHLVRNFVKLNPNNPDKLQVIPLPLGFNLPKPIKVKVNVKRLPNTDQFEVVNVPTKEPLTVIIRFRSKADENGLLPVEIDEDDKYDGTNARDENTEDEENENENNDSEVEDNDADSGDDNDADLNDDSDTDSNFSLKIITDGPLIRPKRVQRRYP